MISDEDKERVRQATDVLGLVGETVELRQRGNSFWGCCPFHQEKSPSFHVDPQTGLWKCFGCGESGDIFGYVMRREHLDFPDSIRYLADRAGIELAEDQGGRRGPRRNRLIEALEEAEEFYSLMLLRGKGRGPQAGRAYLSGRGFGSGVCRSWRLGYAPGNQRLVSHLRSKGFTAAELLAADLALDTGRGRLRDRFFDRVMFPIHDRQGRTIAFGGRVLTDAKPKYLNTKETSVFHKSKHLFAFDRAKDAMIQTGEAIVCEGYTDVIAMHEAGFANTVAALGTALSADHVQAISGFAKTRIVCLFDGDAAGQRAAERAVQLLDRTRLDMVCVVLPNNQDPAEYLAEHGAAAMSARLAEARPLMDFVFERRLASFDLTVPGQRVAALDSLSELLVPLRESVLLDGYVAQLAQMLGVSVREAKRRVMERPVRRPARDDEPRAKTAPPRDEYDLTLLSSDERFAVTAERELLSLMAAAPDAVRPHGDRMATFSWSDARNETMAWAMLATPQGTPPAQVVAAAEALAPEAPRILAGGRIALLDTMDLEQKVAFLLDTVELASCRREIRQIRMRLQSSGTSVPDESTEQLFRRATELQRRAQVLEKQLRLAV